MQNLSNNYLSYLAQQSRLPKITVNEKLHAALTRLDYMLEDICREIELEFYGPFVGVEQREAHQLVVRAHEWKIHQALWSLKVCVATPAANWRAEWAIQGTSRLRKPIIVAALPDFFKGYRAVIAMAGQDTTPAGKRIKDISTLFSLTPS